MENNNINASLINPVIPKHWQSKELIPIFEALQNLQFGSVEIFLQNGKIVQIERNEKFRLEKEKK